MKTIRWILIAFFFVFTVLSSFDFGNTINQLTTIFSIVTLFITVWLHGIERYGFLNTLVFFLITWIVSLFFEALSIREGFPFGYYYYDQLAGPRILSVPIVIMLAYFGMGYVSWILSHILFRQYGQRLSGGKVFLIPLIATFIMVIWDLCMDPLASTVSRQWVWKETGSYFGVPLKNYFGWFLTVYIFLQIFALYIWRFDFHASQKAVQFSKKELWIAAVILYGIQGLSQLIMPFSVKDHPDIYRSMALVTIFTMLFIVVLSFITIGQSSELKTRES